MLSTAGLPGGASSKQKTTTLLAPPPGGAGKIRSALPPPPNDPAVARMTAGRSAGPNPSKESARHGVDSFSDLSAIEVCFYPVPSRLLL